MRATLASRNAHKLEELRAALPGWEIVPVPASVTLPPEEGASYYENAREKARAAAAAAGVEDAPGWGLGEDSGLEAEALDGGPGRHSARWAQGREPERLLEALRDAENRRARYVSELIAVDPDGREYRGTGILDGTIAHEQRGAGGFGFDPVFVPDGETRTVAELGDEWKRGHSHRARAAQALRATLT